MKTFVKIAGTSILLWFILKQIDINQVLATIRSSNVYWILLALLASFFVFILGVFRLNILVNVGLESRIPFLFILSVCWIGMFFNLILPGQLGGDIVKMYRISKNSGKTVKSTAAIIIDRIMGFSSLILIAAAALLFGHYSMNISIIKNSVLILFIASIIFYFLIFNKNIAQKLKFLKVIAAWLKIDHLSKEIYLSFNCYRNHPRALRDTFLISIAANIASFISSYMLFRAIGANIPLVYFFILIPVIGMISILPISLSGIGLQDGAYIFFFSQLGISPAKILGISILSHIFRFGIGLIGGLIYLFERRLEK